MDTPSIKAARERARKLYRDGNDEERQVLDLLLAAADDEESTISEAGADVEGFGVRSGRNIGSAMLRSLDSQGKLGNFQLQDLMNAYNQAETLASSVRKKQDDTNSGIIGKI